MKPDGQTPQDSVAYVDIEERAGAGGPARVTGSSDSHTAGSPDPASDVPAPSQAPASLLRLAPPKPPKAAAHPSDAPAASPGCPVPVARKPFLHDPRLWPSELLRDPRATHLLTTDGANHGDPSGTLPRVPRPELPPERSQRQAVQLEPAEDPQDETTRLYSRNDVDRLLLDADCEAGSLPYELADEPPEDDETRYYVHPAFALGNPNPQGEFGDADAGDELTRAYCPPIPLEPEELGHLERPTTEPWILSSVRAPARSKKRYVLMTLLAVVAAGLWFLGTLRGTGLNMPQVVEARANESPPRVQAPARTLPLAKIWISVEPVDADLTLDGMPVSNPLTLQRRPDGLEHELVARAPGYEILTRRVRLDRDLLVILGLSPSPRMPVSQNEPARTRQTGAATRQLALP